MVDHNDYDFCLSDAKLEVVFRTVVMQQKQKLRNVKTSRVV